MDSIGFNVTSNENSINTNTNGKCSFTWMFKGMIWESFGACTINAPQLLTRGQKKEEGISRLKENTDITGYVRSYPKKE